MRTRARLAEFLERLACRIGSAGPCPTCASALTRANPRSKARGSRLCDACGTTWKR